MFGLKYSIHVFYTKRNTKQRVAFRWNLRTGVKGKGALSERCGGSDIAYSAIFLLAVLVCANIFS